MTNLVTLVNDQESFFSNVLTTSEVNWKKESQFAIQAMTNNEFLGKVALENPVSVQNAIINIAAIGISLNPALKHAYLVPRKVGNTQTVCLDISYQGLLYLAMNTGSIIWGQSKLVYENDSYTNVGLDKAPEHRQDTFGDKGKIIGAYCTVKTPTGDFLTEEMDIEALDKTKATSKAANGPWKNWSEEMQRKTVVKRASKYWPKVDQRLGLAINALNEHEGLDLEKPKEKDVTPLEVEYSLDHFNKNIGAWNAAIEDGKMTKENCIGKILTIGTLTDEQKSQIIETPTTEKDAK